MKRAASYATLLTALAARTAALAEKMHDASAQRIELVACRTGLVDRTDELVLVRRELIDRNDELVRTRGEVVERNDDLVETRAVLASRTDELVCTRDELVGRTSELVQSRATLIARTDELVRERAALAATAEELRQLREINVARSAELDETRRALAHIADALAAREVDLLAAHACAATLNIDLADVRATLVERTARLEAALGIVIAAGSKPLRWALRTNSRRLADRIKPNPHP